MINNFTTRIFLIQLGKAIPFVLAFIVAVCYCESIVAIIFENYMAIGKDVVVLNAPISFTIGKIFQYDWLLLLVLTILSFAIRTCIWNKLCVLYLALQIYEREYLNSIDLYEEQIISIATANIIVCGFLIYKSLNR